MTSSSKAAISTIFFIILAVRWRVMVVHTTVLHWVQRFVPVFEKIRLSPLTETV